MTGEGHDTKRAFLRVGVAILIASATVAGVILLLGAVVVVGSPILLTSLFGTKNGDDLARIAVEARARTMTEGLGYWHEPIDAESLAAREFATEDDASVTVVPFAWEGTVSADSPATVDALIRAIIPAQSTTVPFGPSNTAGAAERCFRFTFTMAADVTRADLDCPTDVGAHRRPTAAPSPSLPPDAEERLRRAMESAGEESPAMAVLTAFPETGTTVDTVVTSDGELVAAVGVAAARECIVMVRRIDGTLERVSFDRIQLEPGEGGCAVELYTDPAL